MAVAENSVASSENNFETTDLERSNGNHIHNNEKIEKLSFKSQSMPKNDDVVVVEDDRKNNNKTDDLPKIMNFENGDTYDHVDLSENGDDDYENIKKNNRHLMNGKEEGFKKDIRDLQEMLSKLNPMAKEFVPTSLVNYRTINNNINANSNNFGFMSNFLIHPNVGGTGGNVNGFTGRKKKNGYAQGKRRMNNRTTMAQREDVIRRTVYVSDIDQQVTEEQLAALFINCGPVVDCRVCGDPNSALRFAFVEFTDEEGAMAALSLSGTVLGFYPIRVLPSKTAIAPVNPTFLPKSEDEREMCARTVYCTNIDKKVTQADVKHFFETYCGEVQRLRLLGDYHHSTRIAFVEFAIAESAIFALSCNGIMLGGLRIRVSPSKTPVRPRPPRSPVH
ncbi:polyadenylate-binding protein-interacting protein 11 [Amaranthus tricolor]|uniref:polyadenylate-binding protein-interacting protein 11 n=1 Tax=Amaranthus tricolor TaxID=29722 RepID=UPI0025881976|nr:polyadenylate-binding protein-interacting protein 11 [Amaranthus tricolor]